MPASPAQIAANQANALKGKGPVSVDGKERSRANSLKHGLTGAGVVLPEADAAEVDRLARAFRDELKPPGDAGDVLVRRMAILAVRMDRSVKQEGAALSERVGKALGEFEAPEGVDDDEAQRLRVEAGHRALFDPSKEACLARKYEAAAERGYFRALKELRLLKKEPARSEVASEVARAQASLAQLGSFFQGERPAITVAPAIPSKPIPVPSKPIPVPSKSLPSGWDPFAPAASYVPFAIGKAR